MELICPEAGWRLDQYLAQAVPGLTRSAAQHLVERGCVTVAGKPVKKNYRTQPGDVIRLTLPEPEPMAAQPREMPLDIVYEDDDLLVINKPKGLVVHPAAGHWDDTLVNGLLYARGDRLSGVKGVLRPGIVHRIDKDTSGLMVVAKNDLAHTVLASQLKDHTLARTYEAIVCGSPAQDAGTVDAPIARHPTERKRMAVVPGGKPAVTHWTVVARYRGYTHLRFRLETGRTHQIRVHMAYLGYPILGDTVYGRKKPELGQSSQCLHASALGFRHPRTGLPVVVTAPLPDYFQAVLDKLHKRTGQGLD